VGLTEGRSSQSRRDAKTRIGSHAPQPGRLPRERIGLISSHMKFLDEAKVYIRSGDGGRGGDVILTTVNGLNTLIDYRYEQHFTAQNGRPGMGKDRAGANGKDLVMRVPAGTQIYEEDGETLLADLTQRGETIVIAKGGNGGFGNAHLQNTQKHAA